MFRRIFGALSKGFRLKRDIVDELSHMDDGTIVPAELIYYTLNKWWGMGLVITKSGRL